MSKGGTSSLPVSHWGNGVNQSPEFSDNKSPGNPGLTKQFGPRGVLKCKATDKDDTTVDARFGKVGKQKIENTGPPGRKRMETVDEEFLAAALDFMKRNTKEKTPFRK